MRKSYGNGFSPKDCPIVSIAFLIEQTFDTFGMWASSVYLWMQALSIRVDICNSSDHFVYPTLPPIQFGIGTIHPVRNVQNGRCYLGPFDPKGHTEGTFCFGRFGLDYGRGVQYSSFHGYWESTGQTVPYAWGSVKASHPVLFKVSSLLFHTACTCCPSKIECDLQKLGQSSNLSRKIVVVIRKKRLPKTVSIFCVAISFQFLCFLIPRRLHRQR